MNEEKIEFEEPQVTEESESVEDVESPSAEFVNVESSIVGSVSAEQDASIQDSVVGVSAAGRDMTADGSVMSVVAVGRDLDFQNGSGLVFSVGNTAEVTNSMIGVLSARGDLTLVDSKVLMTTRQALALGIGIGSTFALLLGLILRLRKR
jgi:hypothetical protein